MENNEFKFKKRFGQNFLKDINIVKKIVKCADISSNDSLVLEVGPGAAIMTKELASVSTNVLAYEIDEDLKLDLNKNLIGHNNVYIKYGDFLLTNIMEDINSYNYKHLYFVSNVPYYITTPILMKLIKSNLSFDKIVMMVQKEVGERFSACPGNKEYSSISVFLNYFYDIKKEFNVSRKQFIPEPNVDSVVISFTEKKNKMKLKNFEFFEQIVRESFQFKRKTIKNNLKKYDLNIVEEILIKYNFNLNTRAEEIPYNVFVELSNSLHN